MDRCAEFGFPMVKCKMCGRPSGVAGRTGMEIEGAVAQASEDRRRDDDGRRERDQPGPAQQIGVQGVEIGRAADGYHRQTRIMPKQHVRERELLGRTRKQNDRIEHCGLRKLVGLDVGRRWIDGPPAGMAFAGATVRLIILTEYSCCPSACCPVLRRAHQKHFEAKIFSLIARETAYPSFAIPSSLAT